MQTQAHGNTRTKLNILRRQWGVYKFGDHPDHHFSFLIGCIVKIDSNNFVLINTNKGVVVKNFKVQNMLKIFFLNNYRYTQHIYHICLIMIRLLLFLDIRNLCMLIRPILRRLE